MIQIQHALPRRRSQLLLSCRCMHGSGFALATAVPRVSPAPARPLARAAGHLQAAAPHRAPCMASAALTSPHLASLGPPRRCCSRPPCRLTAPRRCRPRCLNESCHRRASTMPQVAALWCCWHHVPVAALHGAAGLGRPAPRSLHAGAVPPACTAPALLPVVLP